MKKWCKYAMASIQVIMLFLLLAILFGCKAKQKTKTVTHTQETIEKQSKTTIDEAVDFEAAILAEINRQIDKLENVSVEQVDSSSTVQLKPINPDKPSRAEIGDKRYDFQNTTITISKQKSKSEKKQESKIKKQISDSVASNSKVTAKTETISDRKINKEKDSQTKNKTKHKEGGTPLWLWGLFVLGLIVALFFILRKFKSKITWL